MSATSVMRKLSLFLFLQLCLGSGGDLAQSKIVASRPNSKAAYGQLPLSFERNQGQADGSIGFLARGQGYGLFLTPTAATLKLRNNKTTLRLKLSHANENAALSGLEPLPGRVNYLLGNDPAHWRTDIPTFARVQSGAVYPGIELVYYGRERQLEYDFIVAPGADPARIAWQVEGADKLTLDDAGNLLLHTAGGVVTQQRPVIYQETARGRRAVSGGYRLSGEQIAFDIAAYDTSRTLVIDPVLSLSYGTYLGGSGDDVATDIALDSGGNAYIAGATDSTNFPTRNPAQPNNGGGEIDGFVAKLNPTGTALVYATYLGGNDQDQAIGLAVDPAGNAYVTGQTCSRNFPTRNALQATFGGACDAFVTKLNAAGALDYSTYLGGSSNDPGLAIAADAAGNAYVAGWTNSANFPTRNPLQAMLADTDAFVAKLNAAGSELSYSTFLGGSALDFARAIAVDAAGNAYVTGETRSTNFPLLNPLQPMKGASGGSGDAFVTKFNAAGAALVYSTYLGGSCQSEGWGIAVDAAGSAYVTGQTCSPNFPTANAFQARYGGNLDAFVTKLNPAGTALVYSTYLGGSGGENDEDMGALAVDASGQAYVSGATNSADFPLQSALQGQLRGPGDLFITKFTAAGATVSYSTYLGGADAESLYFGGVAADAQGNAYVVGVTRSKNFPTTAGVVQPAPGSNLEGSLDGFVAKIAAVSSANTATVSAASLNAGPVAPASIVAAFGTDLATATRTAAATPLPTELAGTRVRIRDSAGAETLAPLFFVSPAQLNYLLPPAVALGAATVTVTAGDGFVSTGTIQLARVAPGLFAANANGQGVAAALALRVRADGSQSYEALARFEAAQNRFVALPLDLGAATEQVFLVLYGTGVRGAGSLASVTVRVGGTDAPVVFAGPQPDLTGLDQINARLPRSLMGRGEVEVVLTAEGQAANPVRINIR